MAPYTISFIGSDGTLVDRHERWFEHDDAAIDEAGKSDHAHEILVRQGERLVARFPPLAARTLRP